MEKTKILPRDKEIKIIYEIILEFSKQINTLSEGTQKWILHEKLYNAKREYEFDAILPILARRSKNILIILECKNYTGIAMENLEKYQIEQDLKKFLEKGHDLSEIYSTKCDVWMVFSYFNKDQKTEFLLHKFSHGKGKFLRYKKFSGSKKARPEYFFPEKPGDVVNILFSEPTSLKTIHDYYLRKAKINCVNSKQMKTIQNTLYGKKVVFVEGPAGSGKTALAFSLFGSNKKVYCGWLIKNILCLLKNILKKRGHH